MSRKAISTTSLVEAIVRFKDIRVNKTALRTYIVLVVII